MMKLGERFPSVSLHARLMGAADPHRHRRAISAPKPLQNRHFVSPAHAKSTPMRHFRIITAHLKWAREGAISPPMPRAQTAPKLPAKLATSARAAIQKNILRQGLMVRRRTIPADLANTTQWKIINHLRSLIAQNNSEVICLYHARGTEVDLMPLVRELWQQGKTVALPRVVYRGFPMVFNVWEPNAPLERDFLGLPCADGPEIHPTFIALPMLGYNRKGYRLGYGGGYYDLTLKNLKYPAATAGICHTELEIPHFPAEYHDLRLGYVVTAKEVIICI
jgi:5-formyltetrahydrofolate cyclo-ligase